MEERVFDPVSERKGVDCLEGKRKMDFQIVIISKPLRLANFNRDDLRSKCSNQ